MTRILKNKNNHLVTLDKLSMKFHTGNVLTSAWLNENGISAKLAWWYVHSGWLERIGHQLYKKVGTTVNWSNALFALQNQLSLPIHIGGKSALGILGRAHFIPVAGVNAVTLFANPKINCPHWLFNQSIWNVEFKVYKPLLFTDTSIGLAEVFVNDNTVMVSGPELAILEVLYLAPKVESFETCELLMKGLGQLRPYIVQSLLENCTSAKTKRLFLLLAEKYNHSYLKELDLKTIDLGKGKYVINGGGSYDPKYKISTPAVLE
jgi:hypothetical protein